MSGAPKLSTFHRGVVRELRVLLTQESAVLEIGSTDHSFREHVGLRCKEWLTLDMFPPADIQIDLDDPKLAVPLGEQRFDVVICTEVLEHLRYATALLDNVFRMLKPRGSLVLSVPNMTSLTYRVAWMIGHIPSCAASADLGPDFNGTGYRTQAHDRWVAGHVGDYNLPRLRKLLEHKGFECQRFVGSGLHHRRQIAPAWLVPVTLSSTVLAVARRRGT